MKQVRNNITGDLIRTRSPNEQYSKGWEAIFGKKEKQNEDSGHRQEHTKQEDEVRDSN